MHSYHNPLLFFKAEMIGNPSERDGHDMDIGGVPHVLFVDILRRGYQRSHHNFLKGRPWVVTEEKLLDDTLKASVEVFKLTSQTALESTAINSNDLKVANAGSREYRKAKMLKFLFKEFANHQCGLHQSLLHEERKILQLPM
ncbi:hypothetical protein M0R45_014538 [Rubus argutus]|uniref:Uncharacterized protein n=1 Tax=Rubus argutus TaxID=59490 RepID=A0AAW1XP46_RUBAR